MIWVNRKYPCFEQHSCYFNGTSCQLKAIFDDSVRLLARLLLIDKFFTVFLLVLQLFSHFFFNKLCACKCLHFCFRWPSSAEQWTMLESESNIVTPDVGCAEDCAEITQNIMNMASIELYDGWKWGRSGGISRYTSMPSITGKIIGPISLMSRLGAKPLVAPSSRNCTATSLHHCTALPAKTTQVQCEANECPSFSLNSAMHLVQLPANLISVISHCRVSALRYCSGRCSPATPSAPAPPRAHLRGRRGDDP